MKKIVTLLLAYCFTTSVFAASYYIPNQLDQYNKSGSCEGCDLSQSDLKGFNNADLTGALLVKADLSWSKSFYSSNFSHAKLMYARLSNSGFSGSNFNSADLTGANMERGNFTSCDFTQANLSGTDLSYANLAWAKLSLEQLAKAKTLSCAILPDGTRHAGDNGEDC